MEGAVEESASERRPVPTIDNVPTIENVPTIDNVPTII